MTLKSKLKQIISKHIVSPLVYEHRAGTLLDAALHSQTPGVSDERYGDHEIIVSLTTFGKRLYEVCLTIESIMRQTVKPNRIVLWLGEDVKTVKLPVTLTKQQDRGLEIRYCEDIKAYKKLVPALREFPEAAIITVDDDLLYNFDLVENLVTAYQADPSFIYAARIHRMKLTAPDKLAPYSKWIWNYPLPDVSTLNFATSGGGVLFPPRCFNEEVYNQNVFMEICKYADDVWYKAMSLLNGVQHRKIFTHNPGGTEYITNETFQNTGLSKINNGLAQNDVQLKAVFSRYGLYQFLK